MYLDIHRHSSTKGKADKVLRNLFHCETSEIENTDFCSVGLHPWHVKKDTLQHDIELVRSSAPEKKVFAIGEVGLDKAIDTSLEIQQKAFSAQIEIAKELKKPMIIHCVRAYNELLAFRKSSKHNNPWIIHWYNASSQIGFELIEKGCLLSFGHMLFKETSKAYKTFLEIPLKYVFFETDDAG